MHYFFNFKYHLQRRLVSYGTIYKLPESSPVSANVAEVALTSGIDVVGAVKKAAIGVEPLGKISNC